MIVWELGPVLVLWRRVLFFALHHIPAEHFCSSDLKYAYLSRYDQLVSTRQKALLGQPISNPILHYGRGAGRLPSTWFFLCWRDGLWLHRTRLTILVQDRIRFQVRFRGLHLQAWIPRWVPELRLWKDNWKSSGGDPAYFESAKLALMCNVSHHAYTHSQEQRPPHLLVEQWAANQSTNSVR